MIPRTLISVPSHQGFTDPFRRSLRATRHEFGDRVGYDEILAISHVELARNTLVAKFLRSNFDVMLSIDDDMSWQVSDVEALLAPIAAGKADIVAGVAYAKKTPLVPVVELLQSDVEEERGFVGPTLDVGGHGYFRIAASGAAFLAMTRHAIQTASAIVDSYCPIGSLSQTGKIDERHPLLFRSGVHHPEQQPDVPRFHGEDFGACFAFRKAGFNLWASRDSLPLHWQTQTKTPFGGVMFDLDSAARKTALTASIQRDVASGRQVTEDELQKRIASIKEKERKAS